MRFLLVGPEREENLSIRYLSAALRAAGHEAELAPFDRPTDIPQVLLRSPGFDAVGLSLCSQVRAREFLTLAAALKLQSPAVPVIAGGHYATCAAEELLAHHRELDVIVVHEGERAIVELANAGVRQGALSAIPGLVFRDNGRVVRTVPRHIETDLNLLPHPDRRGRVRMLAGVPTAYIMGSRGCFANCDYCCIVTLHRLAPGPRFRQRSPEDVADEMATLYHERGIRQFVFHDDNFLVRSVEHNHQRLDALDAAWKARGIRQIGIVIKCRPGEVQESVFVRLKSLGLVRVFLGVESASSQGLRAIGREQSVSESAEALALCRRLGISTQYTLMCFHPDATAATVRADLAFFRDNLAHPINFCRTEIYAGTPLEARMRAEGRARGDYIARTYSIADSVVSDTCKLTGRIFHERCWATDSLMETAIGLDHLAAILRHFRPGAATEELALRIADWRDRTNLDTVSLLDDLLGICERHPGLENPALHRAARALVQREVASRCELGREGLALRREASAVGRAQVATRRSAPASMPAGPSCAEQKPGAEAAANGAGGTDLRATIMRAAAAATIAIAVTGCSGSTSDTAVSESAPTPMLIDSDDDGLPDLCETSVFGTDPDLADSDEDGTDDGAENHDGGMLTNLEEAEANDPDGDTCRDIDDTAVSEYAPPMLQDSDDDGLPNICETAVFGTDPNDADSDSDGTPDGAENHDGGTMTNLQEAQANDSNDNTCRDITDTAVSEAAPPMMVDTDGDGLPDICETSVFHTDPDLTDSDEDGTLDGAENHDSGTMTNLQEADANDPDGDTCTDIYDTAVSEAAPPMMMDSDGDGLPNICEQGVFGTDPYAADSDEDGTPDGEENHDSGTMTNLEEADANDQWGSSCSDIDDTPVDEAAPAPMQVDTDDDGLPDICETGVFGTDPGLTDSDEDGTPDAEENHDGGMMTNLQEADANAPDGDTCTDIFDTAVSEAAPPMMMDSDYDGLPDICEQGVFGTDPYVTDSDEDGTPDGEENHDGGTMTNLEEADANDQWGSSCSDIDDTPVDEAAPAPMQVDTDDDGLPDICETGVFGTDPELTDSDGDGTPDSDENHDFGTMTNLQEADANAPDGDTCTDIFDTAVSEAAPPMMMDGDGDGLPDICEAAVFGTDPNVTDSDEDGTPDGEENHDGGTMTNRQEADSNDRYGYTCVDIEDSET